MLGSDTLRRDVAALAARSIDSFGTLVFLVMVVDALPRTVLVLVLTHG